VRLSAAAHGIPARLVMPVISPRLCTKCCFAQIICARISKVHTRQAACYLDGVHPRVPDVRHVAREQPIRPLRSSG